MKVPRVSAGGGAAAADRGGGGGDGGSMKVPRDHIDDKLHTSEYSRTAKGAFE